MAARIFYQDEAVTLWHGDCRHVLLHPDLEEADHLITDPPYSDHVHGKARRGSGGPGGESSDLGFEPIDDATRDFIGLWCASRVARWSIVFSDVESAPAWRRSFCDVPGGRMEYIRTGAWVKLGATPQFTGDRPAVGFEALTICHRTGKKRWNGGGSHAVWTHAIVTGRDRVHTTQKPETLLVELVSQFTDPGDLILDPFGGSGTTAVAAKRLGRRCIAIESDEGYCRAAAKRLSQGALDLFGATA